MARVTEFLGHGIMEIMVHKRPLTRHYRSNPKVAFWLKFSCCRNLSALLITYKNRCFIMKLHFSGNIVDKEAFLLTYAVFRLERATEVLELTCLGKYFACVNAN